MRSALCGLMISLAALGAPEARAAGAPAAPSPDQRGYIAAKLYSDLQAHFAHWQENEGVKLDEALKTYLAKAMAAPDRLSFDLETIAFLAQFSGGRTGFSDSWLHEGYPALPFSVRRVARDWVVTHSRLDALKPGDVIVQIDGAPIESFYQDHARFLSGGTDEAKRAALFAMPSLFPAPLTLGLADGRSVSVDAATAPPAPAAEVAGKWLKPDELGYIAIPAFDAPSETQAVELIKQYGAASTLVLDLRGARGDAAPTALLAALMNRPYRGWAAATPASPQPQARPADLPTVDGQPRVQRADVLWPATIAQPAPDAYGRQLILLIDSGCAGACEDFVMPFKDNGRAVLIGEPTQGRTGTSMTEDLGDGMTAWISTASVSFPNGAPLTAAGIAPDVAVAPGISDIKAGLDPVIAKVLIQTAPGAQQDRRAP